MSLEYENYGSVSKLLMLNLVKEKMYILEKKALLKT